MINDHTTNDPLESPTRTSLGFFPKIGKTISPTPSPSPTVTPTPVEQHQNTDQNTIKLPEIKTTVTFKTGASSLAVDELKKEKNNALNKDQKITEDQEPLPFIVYNSTRLNSTTIENRKIIVVDAGNDKKQAFYQSTGTSSYSRGTWFPFDFINTNEDFYKIGWISKTDLNFEPTVAKQSRLEVCGIFNQMLTSLEYPLLQPVFMAKFGQLEINRFANQKFMEISAKLGGGFWDTDYGKIIIKQQNWNSKIPVARRVTPLPLTRQIQFRIAARYRFIQDESDYHYAQRMHREGLRGHIVDIHEWLIRQKFKINPKFEHCAFPPRKRQQPSALFGTLGLEEYQAPKLWPCYDR